MAVATCGTDNIDRLIAHKDKRLSTLDQVKKHPFFRGVSWDNLRETAAPFVPALDSEIE
jgi:cell cycle protein kinase DBF2